MNFLPFRLCPLVKHFGKHLKFFKPPLLLLRMYSVPQSVSMMCKDSWLLETAERMPGVVKLGCVLIGKCAGITFFFFFTLGIFLGFFILTTTFFLVLLLLLVVVVVVVLLGTLVAVSSSLVVVVVVMGAIGIIGMIKLLSWSTSSISASEVIFCETIAVTEESSTSSSTSMSVDEALVDFVVVVVVAAVVDLRCRFFFG